MNPNTERNVEGQLINKEGMSTTVKAMLTLGAASSWRQPATQGSGWSCQEEKLRAIGNKENEPSHVSGLMKAVNQRANLQLTYWFFESWESYRTRESGRSNNQHIHILDIVPIHTRVLLIKANYRLNATRSLSHISTSLSLAKLETRKKVWMSYVGRQFLVVNNKMATWKYTTPSFHTERNYVLSLMEQLSTENKPDTGELSTSPILHTRLLWSPTCVSCQLQNRNFCDLCHLQRAIKLWSANTNVYCKISSGYQYTLSHFGFEECSDMFQN